MEPHVKIRKDYVKLVRQGKMEEAQVLLGKIWNRNIPKEADVPIKQEQIVDAYETISSLSKISGIGAKTIKDIKKMFNNMDELKIALKSDNVGLRDDIVKKLIEEIL